MIDVIEQVEQALIYPSGMIKKLVGEELICSINLNPEFDYRVELYGNINRIKETYPMDREDDRYILKLPLIKSGFFEWQVRYQRSGSKTWRWIKDKQGKRFVGQLQVDPEWLNQAIAYNVFVRFFNGVVKKDNQAVMPGEGGTFDDVKAYLDELVKMGISILYFNPIHLIGELYRKYNILDELPSYWQPGSPYSIKDYKSIDPELTYDKDTKKHLMSDPHKEFLDLIQAAHDRKMYVIMDLVFNHTAHDFVFQRIRPEWYLYKENIHSLTDPYLYPKDRLEGKPWGDNKHTMSPYDHGLWFEDAAQLNWEYMIPKGPNKAPKNPSLKEMWEYFKSIPRYWIKHFGIDGFRCDVAYRVPSTFWRACISEARVEAQASKLSLSKDAVFIAESYTDNLLELQEAGFAAVYGDFSNKLGKPDDLLGYLGYMYNLHNQHFPEGSKWFIFPESHDFARTSQKILGEANSDTHLSYLANKTRWFITATAPGVPLVFNGFEKVELKPVNLFSYGAVDWNNHSDLQQFIIMMNDLRKSLPALSLTAEFIPLLVLSGDNPSDKVAAYKRHQGSQTLIVVVNMNVKEKSGKVVIDIREEALGSYRLKDLISDTQIMTQKNRMEIELKPAECLLLLLQKFN